MVKYPKGIQKESTGRLTTNYANRGMTFEQEIEAMNEIYNQKKWASIHKRPTPIQIVRTKYSRKNHKSRVQIVDAFFKKKSTVDFEGISRGIHLEFDCKECQFDTRFPLSYIEPHQIRHLKQVEEQGGIGFILIKMTKDHSVYLVRIQQIIEWLNATRKSIPRQWLDQNTKKVPRYGLNLWDYLPIVWEEAKE